MNLRIFDSVDELMSSAARTIVQSNARSIALSGGSTPEPLYRLLGHQLRDEPVTWVVVDERYVPIDDPKSNAGMRVLSSVGVSATSRSRPPAATWSSGPKRYATQS